MARRYPPPNRPGSVPLLLLISAFTMPACSGSAVEAPEDLAGPEYTCTQVIGFSQTRQWFLAENWFRVSSSWQLLAQNGAAIDRWLDPNYDGWFVPLQGPCSSQSRRPDRIVFTTSGGLGVDETAWRDAIAQLLPILREKYRSVRLIVFQPVVGGPNHSICEYEGQPVRASVIHPVIDAAIASSIQDDDAVAGASPEVTSCIGFSDATGHLTDISADNVGSALKRFYQTF